MLPINRSSESKIIDSILKEARINKKAVDFATKEQYDAYMKEHPDADPKNHKVVETKEKSGPAVEPEKKEELKEKIEKKKEEIQKPKKQTPIHKQFDEAKISDMSRHNIKDFHKGKKKTSWSAFDSRYPDEPIKFELFDDGEFYVSGNDGILSKSTKKNITNEKELKEAINDWYNDDVWEDF